MRETKPWTFRALLETLGLLAVYLVGQLVIYPAMRLRDRWLRHRYGHNCELCSREVHRWIPFWFSRRVPYRLCMMHHAEFVEQVGYGN